MPHHHLHRRRTTHDDVRWGAAHFGTKTTTTTRGDVVPSLSLSSTQPSGKIQRREKTRDERRKDICRAQSKSEGETLKVVFP
jgi:hypothetical protein